MRGVVLVLSFIFLHVSIERMDKINAPTPARVIYLIFWALLLTWAMWLTPAAAQELSPDYQQGFCDGSKIAHEASMFNRDNNRKLTASLMGRPFETYEEAIKRIYAQHGKDWCLQGPTLVHDSECLMLDRIDLYVVLPPWRESQILIPKGIVNCSTEVK